MSTSDEITESMEPYPKLENFSIWDIRKELALCVVILLITYLIQVTKGFRKDGSSSGKKQRTTLSNIPTPFALPLIGTSYHGLLPGAEDLKIFMKWATKYGKIYRLWCFRDEFYVLNDPSMIQKILSSTNTHHMNRHKVVCDTVLSSCLVGGLLNSEYETWNPHRKILSRFFTYKSYQHQGKIMNLHTKAMITSLKESEGLFSKSRSKQVAMMDIGETVHQTLIRTILHLLLDADLFSAKEEADFHRKFTRGKQICARRVLEPWLLISPIWKLHPLSKEISELEISMGNFIKTVLDRFRSKRRGERREIISPEEDEDAELGIRKFKCIMEEMLDAGMTDKEIQAESFTILFAGHETTSTAMVFFLLRLALDPEHQERCREEVDELFERKTGSENVNPLELDLSMEDLCQLKHVERCINENLRLLPTVPAFIRRLDEPLELDDAIELKANSYIGIVPWTLHRDPEIWPDPERFDPDRFLPENIKKRHPYAYLPFSAGPRNCIGLKTAQMNLKIMTAWILRYFEVHTSDKWEDITLTLNVTLDTAKKINLSFKPRNGAETI